MILGTSLHPFPQKKFVVDDWVDSWTRKSTSNGIRTGQGPMNRQLTSFILWTQIQLLSSNSSLDRVIGARKKDIHIAHSRIHPPVRRIQVLTMKEKIYLRLLKMTRFSTTRFTRYLPFNFIIHTTLTRKNFLHVIPTTRKHVVIPDALALLLISTESERHEVAATGLIRQPDKITIVWAKNSDKKASPQKQNLSIN